jgi:uncharacterized protein (TIGR00661 family)
MLEIHLTEEVKRFDGKVVFIRGVIEKEQTKQQSGNVTFYNFMKTRQLEQTFNESEKVLCRSGYTTIMDLVKLNKKAFFIPTPGQYEQIYLAEKLQNEGLVPYATQDKFKIEDLEQIEQFEGLRQLNGSPNWEELFKVF